VADNSSDAMSNFCILTYEVTKSFPFFHCFFLHYLMHQSTIPPQERYAHMGTFEHEHTVVWALMWSRPIPKQACSVLTSRGGGGI